MSTPWDRTGHQSIVSVQKPQDHGTIRVDQQKKTLIIINVTNVLLFRCEINCKSVNQNKKTLFFIIPLIISLG